MRVLLCALGLSAWVLFALPGCGGPTFDGKVYRGSDVSFRVGPLESDWRRIDVDGALLAFRDDESGATIAMNGRCGLDGDDVPLHALTHHLFLNFTKRRVESQQAVTLDGREALRTELSADLDGVSKQFVVYVLKKDGCVYDFLWIGADGSPQASAAEFQQFVQGFSTKI
jgi:hypothetical protein